MAVARENIETDIENIEDQEGGTLYSMAKSAASGAMSAAASLGRSNKDEIPQFKQLKPTTTVPPPTTTSTNRGSYIPSMVSNAMKSKIAPMSSEVKQKMLLLESSTDDSIKKDMTSFEKEYNTLFDNLNSSDIALQSQVVRLINLFCKITLHRTRKHTTRLFNDLTIYNTMDEAAKLSFVNDRKAEYYNDPAIKIEEKIKRTINKYYQQDTPNDIIKDLFLRLLIICYYPPLVLENVKRMMTDYISIINKTSSVILSDDTSIDTIRQLVNKVLQETSQPIVPTGGGTGEKVNRGMFENVMDFLSSKPPDLGDSTAANNFLQSQNEKAADAFLASEEEKSARRADAAAATAAAAAAATENTAIAMATTKKFIGVMKNYDQENPYIKNSGRIFYNALTNFATSISIKEYQEHKSETIQYRLYDLFLRLLDIVDDDKIVDNDADRQRKIAETNTQIKQLEDIFYKSFKGIQLRRLEQELEEGKSRYDAGRMTPQEKDDYEFTKLDYADKKVTFARQDEAQGGVLEYYNITALKDKLITLQQPAEIKREINRLCRELVTHDKSLYEQIRNNVFPNTVANPNSDYNLAINTSIINGIKQSNMFLTAEVSYIVNSGSNDGVRSSASTSAATTAPASAATTALASAADGSNDGSAGAGAGVGAGAVANPATVARMNSPLRVGGGKRRTRRYKKRAGTRRQKKRRGTHRKRKNTTR